MSSIDSYAARDRRPLHVDAPDEFENSGFFCHALGNDRIKGPEFEEILNPPVHVLADKDRCPGLLVQAFKTRREINGVAERGIVHALGRSDIADHGFADMNAEPRNERLQSIGLEFGVKPLTGSLGREHRPAGARDVVRLADWGHSRTP